MASLKVMKKHQQIFLFCAQKQLQQETREPFINATPQIVSSWFR